ncbi:acetolactate synthase large subunit [soil metagenome]
MNGAEATLATLADAGVDACFANPGTSEMQMVAAFDREPRVRPILALFEGVVTGAADGYARVAGKPAATLLHLGAGLGNGVANLHNAKKGYSPIVNLVGDHAVHHQPYDAPLASDILGIARPVSVWAKASTTADTLVALSAEAVAASQGALPGPATLTVPADAAWSPATGRSAPRPVPARGVPSAERIEALAKRLRGAKKPVVLMGSLACTDRGIRAAGRLSALGWRVMTDTFISRLPRGAGRYAPDRMMYFGEMALADLAGSDLLVLAGTKLPVAFFAYPAMPSVLVPEGCETAVLAEVEEDAVAALEALADAAGAPERFATVDGTQPGAASGELTAYSVGESLSRHMPDHALVCDDAVTAGLPIFMQTKCARPHDWMMLTGGAIGWAMPAAIGAGVAAPDRKVVSLTGDGAGAYTVQSLWTMARENLDVTVVVFANHSYRILNIEMARTGSGQAGPRASQLLDLSHPKMSWCDLAKGFGVPATRCTDAPGFDEAFAKAMHEPGPKLIEAVFG